MKERPILFRDEMVRAILEGRKTQARRIVTPQPILAVSQFFRAREDEGYAVRVNYLDQVIDPRRDAKIFRCPYGRAGDRLWVKERFAVINLLGFQDHRRNSIAYGYNGKSLLIWWPSIQMPRWASRITLEITGVRTERAEVDYPEDKVKKGQWFWEIQLKRLL